MNIEIPDFSLVVLIGSTGSGKSTFAAKHFLPTEVISSDHCRGLVCDDATDQGVTADAFELVREIAGKRLKNRRLAVIDATNVRAAERKGFVELARKWHALPVAIVFDPGIDICITRNKTRPDRPFGGQVVQRMVSEIRRGLGGLQREGFRQVWKLGSTDLIEAATVARQPLWTDKRTHTGPFDIIGDVHGCADELQALLARLGYRVEWSDETAKRTVTVTPPEGRKLVFVGDLVDRGPNTPDVLRIAMSMTAAGTAYAVQGNHDRKLERWLAGRKVTVAHGLQQTIDQLAGEDRGFREAVATFLDGLRSHVWLDGGRLAVAHAGLKEEMIGRGSGAVREFALFGETTGEIDEFGLPVRADWAANYRGPTTVVYGHTPVVRAEWVNNTICIDTGCVFGGSLTALRWPEKEIVDVAAERTWCEPIRPLASPAGTASAQANADRLLDIDDVCGRRWIDTELRGRIVVAEENASAALEVMSRFALAPQWLAYLPPTMVTLGDQCARRLAGAARGGVFAFSRARRGRSGLRREANGLAGRDRAVPVGGGGPRTVRRHGQRERRNLDPHRPRLLQRCRNDRSRFDEAAACRRRSGALGRVHIRLAAARRRDHALVGQGRKPDREPVCAGCRIVPGRSRCGRGRAGAGRQARPRRRRHPRPLR
jgi:protein phosphatase